MTPLIYAYRPARNRLTLAECVAALRCDLGRLEPLEAPRTALFAKLLGRGK